MNCEFCKQEDFKSDIKDLIYQIPNNFNLKAVMKYESCQEEIDTVASLFSDNNSMELYKKEILYCLYSDIYNLELLNSHLGLMTPSEFKRMGRKAVRDIKDSDIQYFFSEVRKLYPSSPDCCNWLAVCDFTLEQYRYEDIVKIENGDVVIDAGGCLGDSALYSTKNGASDVYSFEIDKNNLSFFKRVINSGLKLSNVHLIDKALSDSNATVYYTPDRHNSGAGKISDKRILNSYPVDVTTIDEFCESNNIHPTFIKMDIEGAEYVALKGAERTIKKYKPKLAICIYHSFQDRYRLPLLIHSFLPDYQFYLKKSTPWVETVLFCKI